MQRGQVINTVYGPMEIIDICTEHVWAGGALLPKRTVVLGGRENCSLSRMTCDINDPILESNNSGNFADGEPTGNGETV